MRPSQLGRSAAKQQSKTSTLSRSKGSSAKPARVPQHRVTTSATAYAALATVTGDALPKPAPLDVEGAKLLYLSLWFHPRCGGRPVAYVERRGIACDNCNYRYPCLASEALGVALTASEFRPKKEHPAWLT